MPAPNVLSEVDVFISHSDGELALRVKALLETAGLRAWVAERDIPGGVTWPGNIVLALQHARCVVVLVTPAANASEHVHREVSIAFQHRVPVLQVRTDDLPLSRDLAYFFTNMQWIRIAPDLGPDDASHLLSSVRNAMDATSTLGAELRRPRPLELQSDEFAALRERTRDLLEWPQTLEDGTWLERPELGRLLAAIEGGGPCRVAVLGPPGCGKSALLARLGAELVRRGAQVVAIKADRLPQDIDSPASMRRWLELPEPLGAVLSGLARKAPLTLLVDQLDALGDLVDLKSGRLNVLLSLIRELEVDESVRLVFSCRAFEYERDARLRRIAQGDAGESIELELPSWESIATHLEGRGFDPTRWPDSFHRVLRTPAHLSLFLRHATPASPMAEHDNWLTMMEELWRRIVVGHEDRIRVMSGLVRRLVDDEVVWAPAADFDADRRALEQLVADGLLTFGPGRRSVGFAHQTIGDFARARAFATSSARSLSEFVLVRQDAMFIRATLWTSLLYLRGADPQAYSREFEALWTDVRTREHVRQLLTEFLGQVEDPSDEEWAWLLPSLLDPTRRQRVLAALRGNLAWFDRLRPHVLPLVLESDFPSSGAAWPVLLQGLSSRADDVLDLLEQTCLADRAKADWAVALLCNLERWDARAMDVLDQLLAKGTPDRWSVQAVLEASASFEPGRTVQSLEAVLRRASEHVLAMAPSPPAADAPEAVREGWTPESARKLALRQLIEEQAHSGIGAKLAEAAPREFCERIGVWLFRALEHLDSGPRGVFRGLHDDDVYDIQNDEQAPEPDFLQALRAAARAFAGQAPADYITWAKSWERSNLRSVHRVLIAGLVELAPSQPRIALEYLLRDSRRLRVGDYPDEHRDSAALIRAVTPHLTTTQRSELLAFVESWQCLPLDADTNVPIKERRSAMTYNRRARLPLLLAFDPGSLSPSERRRILAEERALGPVRPRGPTVAGHIRSPVSARQMALASPEDFRRLVEEEAKRPAWPDRIAGDPFVGGFDELVAEMGELAKSHPELVMDRLAEMPAGQGAKAAGHVLLNLPRHDALDLDRVVARVVELERKGFSEGMFRQGAATLLRDVAEKSHGLSDEVVAMVEEWFGGMVLEDRPRTPDESSPRASRSGAIVESMDVRTIPVGATVLDAALAGLTLRTPPALDRAAALVERHLGKAASLPVWKALIHQRLPSLVAALPKSRGEELVRQLFDHHPELLASPSGPSLLARTWHRYAPATFQAWLETIRDGAWEEGPRAFGELVAICAQGAQNGWARDVALQGVANGPADILTGLGWGAALVWDSPGFRATATDLLIGVARRGDAASHESLLRVLRHLDRYPKDSNLMRLVEVVRENLPQLLADTLVLRHLTDMVDVHPELVLSAAESIVQEREPNRAQKELFRAVADEIVSIAVTAQRMTPFRSRGLALLEGLLGRQVQEAETVLWEADRRPGRTGKRRPVPRRTRSASNRRGPRR